MDDTRRIVRQGSRERGYLMAWLQREKVRDRLGLKALADYGDEQYRLTGVRPAWAPPLLDDVPVRPDDAGSLAELGIRWEG